MALERITAPFSPEAVQALNEYQTDTSDAPPMHPFTCANRGDGNHGSEGGDLGVLIATVDGWVCPHCHYVQDWAHGFMADSTRAFMAHPWETATETERNQAKLERATKLLGEYDALLDRIPGCAGALVMVACLDTRSSKLQRKLDCSEAKS